MFDRNDPSCTPTLDDLAHFIATPLWLDFLDHVQTTYPVKPVFTYSKCSLEHGWNVKFQKSRKTLCTVYPRTGDFCVMVVIADKQRPLLFDALPTFSDAVRTCWQNTREANGQRWLMLDAINEDVLSDIKTLLAIRAATAL